MISFGYPKEIAPLGFSISFGSFGVFKVKSKGLTFLTLKTPKDPKEMEKPSGAISFGYPKEITFWPKETQTRPGVISFGQFSKWPALAVPRAGTARKLSAVRRFAYANAAELFRAHKIGATFLQSCAPIHCAKIRNRDRGAFPSLPGCRTPVSALRVTGVRRVPREPRQLLPGANAVPNRA